MVSGARTSSKLENIELLTVTVPNFPTASGPLLYQYYLGTLVWTLKLSCGGQLVHAANFFELAFYGDPHLQSLLENCRNFYKLAPPIDSPLKTTDFLSLKAFLFYQRRVWRSAGSAQHG
jgi:hypothetical protein